MGRCGVHVVVCMLWYARCGVHVVVCTLWCACCGVHVVVCMLWCACCGAHVVVCMLWCACCGVHVQRGEWESQSTTKFLVEKPLVEWTTCFGPNAGPLSGLKEIS
jgi:hypothetical protein